MNLKEMAEFAKTVLEMGDFRPEFLRRLTVEAPTTAAYNRFLFELSNNLKPKIVIETGTDRGRSAAHFSAGNPFGLVHTIDIDQACKNEVDALGRENIFAHVGDSIELASLFPDGKVDIVFLDSLHVYEHVSKEWKLYRPKLKSSGIALFDDIHLDGGMEKFWAEVRDPKVDLSFLHYSGFGAVCLES